MLRKTTADRRRATPGVILAGIMGITGFALANDPLPQVTNTCLVGPDMLAITIEAGKVTLGRLEPYVPQPGDDLKSETKKADTINVEIITLKRGNKEIGKILGEGDKRQIIFPATYRGDFLQTDVADRTDSYTITSADDPAYAAGLHPATVHRKSKPIDENLWVGQPMRHVISLKLPGPLVEGKTYQINCGQLNVKTPTITFRNDTRATRSLAVHTTQIGYRADDPFKRGYLSFWLGASTGSGASGVYSYPAGLKFHLLENTSGKDVFSGTVEMAVPATTAEPTTKVNYNGTDVLRMDFSSFNTPGHYRLYVEGIGCGYPFAIGPDTWEHAFYIQNRGLFHQRSGIALGPPYTTFVKPRDHHPADGVPVILTKYAFSIWKDAPKHDNYDYEKMSTSQRVTNAWGGYHDAGDWNPRGVYNLKVTLAQLEIADLFPTYVEKIKLNIPQDYTVPDIFNEALWPIDCFRRVQTPDGGVGWGLETPGDPVPCTVSWLTKMLPVYVMSPDAGNSWYYAATAARVARLLKRYDTKLAAVYEESARKAMSWAETDFASQCKAKAKSGADLNSTARDNRNLAAVEMLRLTGDRHWHDVFMENTVLTNDNPNLFAWPMANQEDAAFAYAIADEKLTDPLTRKRAVQGLEKMAKAAIANGDGSAFDIVAAALPKFMGFYSSPKFAPLVLRAYHVTGKKEYLVAGLRAAQFSSGANPENIVQTTGLGSNPIHHPLRVDPHGSGQPMPEGITPLGINDYHFSGAPSMWAFCPKCPMMPPYLKWPVTELYVDTFNFVMVNESMLNMSYWPCMWTWGYLAGRPATIAAK